MAAGVAVLEAAVLVIMWAARVSRTPAGKVCHLCLLVMTGGGGGENAVLSGLKRTWRATLKLHKHSYLTI